MIIIIFSYFVKPIKKLAPIKDERDISCKNVGEYNLYKRIFL